jgi:hypothetical protein
LFGIAVLQFVCGLATVGIPANEPGAMGEMPHYLIVFTVVEVVGYAVMFAGLGFWALYQPLPPLIIGLALYIVLSLVTIAANLEPGGQGTAGIWIRVVIVIGLIKALASVTKSSKPEPL